MDRKTLCEALRSVAPRLDADFPGWAVFGGAALVLNGVEGISTRDIDIIVPAREDLPLPNETDGRFRSQQRMQMEAGGVEVDVSVGLEVKSRGRWQRVSLQQTETDGGIRYASRSECLRLLRLFNRPKDRERLRLLRLSGPS